MRCLKHSFSNECNSEKILKLVVDNNYQSYYKIKVTFFWLTVYFYYILRKHPAHYRLYENGLYKSTTYLLTYLLDSIMQNRTTAILPLTAISNSAVAFPTELVAVTLTLPVLRPVSDFKVNVDCPSVVSMMVVDDGASGSSLRLHSTLGAGIPPTFTGMMRLAPAFSCWADLNFAS